MYIGIWRYWPWNCTLLAIPSILPTSMFRLKPRGWKQRQHNPESVWAFHRTPRPTFSISHHLLFRRDGGRYIIPSWYWQMWKSAEQVRRMSDRSWTVCLRVIMFAMRQLWGRKFEHKTCDRILDGIQINMEDLLGLLPGWYGLSGTLNEVWYSYRTGYILHLIFLHCVQVIWGSLFDV